MHGICPPHARGLRAVDARAHAARVWGVSDESGAVPVVVRECVATAGGGQVCVVAYDECEGAVKDLCDVGGKDREAAGVSIFPFVIVC